MPGGGGLLPLIIYRSIGHLLLHALNTSLTDWPGHRHHSAWLRRSTSDTVRCGRRKQYLTGHKETIHGQSSPQFIVANGHNMWKVTKRLCVFKGRHSSLWPMATTFEKSQRGYASPKTTTICCGQWSQHLKGHSETMHIRRHHNFLWPTATIVEMSQRGYEHPKAAIFCCGWWPQHLKVHRKLMRLKAICGLRLLQFIVV